MVDKVELYPGVVRFLKYRCTPNELTEFYETLERVVADPIQESEHVSVPHLSRYMLRFFRFGRSLAVFEYNANKNRVRVLECRRLKPQPPP